MDQHWAKNEHTEQVCHHSFVFFNYYYLFDAFIIILCPQQKQKAFTKSEYQHVVTAF